MKFSKKEIVFIDNWLWFSGIEYVDIRYELVDHLASEYEKINDTIDLESFIKKRLEWCKILAKKNESAMHWRIQKQLLKRFLSLFLNINCIGPLILYVFAILAFEAHFSEKTISILLIAPIFATFLLFAVNYFKKGHQFRKKKNILSIIKLRTLTAIPQIFICIFMNPLDWVGNCNILIPCTIIFSMGNLAALLEYNRLYKKVLKEYEFLRPSSL